VANAGSRSLGGAPGGVGGRLGGATTGAGGRGNGGGSGSAGHAGGAQAGGTLGAGGAGGTVGSGGPGGASGVGGITGFGGGRGASAATGGTASGGSVGAGGTGGAVVVGGAGGTVAGPTAGTISAGGTIGEGGSVSSGGMVSSGGLPGSGGLASSGGNVSNGGTIAAGGTGGSSTVGLCGNGMVDTGEQCDLGHNNENLPAFWVTQTGVSFAATPVMRVATGADFYNYTSSSAHTGFEALETSRIMLYLDKTTLALSLVLVHGIDSNTTGQNQPESQVQMLFSGLPATTTVAVSDDSGELTMTSTTTAAGKWSFNGNTDGGVLTGLTFPGNWEIYVSPAFLQGITTWTWVQSDGSFVGLDLTQPLTVKAYASPSLCRLNCTIPRCGDGILDGGETCDDGGALPGNGCAANCMSFN
jgi:cysteine-rich repeat protein